MSKAKLLIQIDSDPSASTFDSIVAIDSGVDQLLTRSGVSTVEVQSLVHGAMFTRGADDLKYTALFFGGSDVEQAESLVRAAKKSFFGPVRVSLMSDPNGSNTTAAAAVIAAQRHLSLKGSVATVLAGTGPVGRRIVHLLAGLGATVRLCSRSQSKANAVAQSIRDAYQAAGKDLTGEIIGTEVSNKQSALRAVTDAAAIFGAGAAGVELLDGNWRKLPNPPAVIVDINAVPPAGIDGIDVTDKGVSRHGAACYGAIGVGGLKMKIHRRCIKQLFESNDQQLETDEIYRVGQAIVSES